MPPKAKQVKSVSVREMKRRMRQSNSTINSSQNRHTYSFAADFDTKIQTHLTFSDKAVEWQRKLGRTTLIDASIVVSATKIYIRYVPSETGILEFTCGGYSRSLVAVKDEVAQVNIPTSLRVAIEDPVITIRRGPAGLVEWGAIAVCNYVGK